MLIAIKLAVVIVAGIQFGSVPLKDGGNTYIVQIEPDLFDTIKHGGLSSEVPPGLRDMRRVEIRVGDGPLPNRGVTVLKPVADADKPKAEEPTLADTIQFAVGAQPLKTGGNSFIVEIDPAQLGSFRSGGFASDLPPGLHDIRRIEIRVGDATLPNQGLAAFKVPVPGDATKQPRLDADTSSRQADANPPRAQTAGFPPDDRQRLQPLPPEVPASPIFPPKDHRVDTASYQFRDPTGPGNDGGPTAAGNATAIGGPSASPRLPASRESDNDWASIPLLAALGALIISAAGNVYLLWIHMGTRRRYQEVVQQLHETELPVAVPPLGDE